VTLQDDLAAESTLYLWLVDRRVRTAEDPDLAATVARLFDEREYWRQRAEAAEAVLDHLTYEVAQ
jgi:hypothetical protein